MQWLGYRIVTADARHLGERGKFAREVGPIHVSWSAQQIDARLCGQPRAEVFRRGDKQKEPLSGSFICQLSGRQTVHASAPAVFAAMLLIESCLLRTRLENAVMNAP